MPDNQSRLTIPFFNYADESDLDGGVFPNGLYLIPANMPVEGWPKATGSLTPEQSQQDVNDTGGDPFDHRRARRRLDLGNVARAPNDKRLGSLEWREV